MKQAFLPLYIALALCLFTAAGYSNTLSWKNGSSGNWSDPANWHPAQVPGPADTAVINVKGTYTVTLDTNASVGGLTLGANDGNTQTLHLGTNTFTLGGQVIVTNGGFFDLSSGTLFGATNGILTGTFTCAGATLAGVLTLASNSVINLYASGPSNVFSGLTVFTNYGTINWSNVDLACPASLICNYGLWDAKANNTFHGSTGGASAFNNYGTFRKDGGNSTTLLDSNTVFHNAGTLDIEVGGVTLSSGNGGGQFNTATNAGFSLGNFTLTGDATFTGPGPAQGNLSGNNGIIHGGLNLANGSLSGTLTVASNSVVNLVGGGPIGLNSLTLTNCGTINWRGTGLECQSYSVIDNYGLWDAQDNHSLYGGFGVTMTIFNNYGTFRKSGGSLSGGDTSLDNTTTFNNFGTIDTEVGLLQPWMCPFYCSSGSVINTASNAINNLGLNVSGDVYFTGAGNFDGGLHGSNGVIHGTVDSPNIGLAGVLTLASNSVLYLAEVPQQLISFEGTTFTNYGTVICTSDHLGGDGSPQIYNYGLWDFVTYTEFLGANGGDGGTTTFNNYGIVRKDGDSSSTAFFDSATIFNNLGTVDAESGTLTITTGNGTGVFNAASNAVVYLGNFGIFTLSGDSTFSGSGQIWGNLNGFNGIIHGALNFSSGTLQGTLTVASNAVANLAGAVNLNILTLTNYGTVVWNTDLQCSSGVQVYNYGLWDAPAGSTFSGDYGGGPFFSTFNNYGIVRKDGDPGSTAFFDNATTFNNLGTVDTESGNLTITTGSGTGVFNAANNTVLWLGNFDIFTLSGASTFTGPGLVAGTLNGNNAVIHGALNFYFGTLQGTLTVASNAVANLAQANGSEGIDLDVLTLTNCGTVIWSNLDLQCHSGVQVYNYGLWDALTGNMFEGNAGGGPFFSTFNNFGIVRKNGDAGSTATFDSATTFNNLGTVDDESGTLTLTTGNGTGVFNAASNAIVYLGNFNIFTLSGDSTFTGPGLVAGDLNGNNGVIHGSLNFYFGTLQGTLTVASNAVANLAQANGQTQPISLSILTLTNCGTVVWSNLDLQCSSGAQVYNYGLWDALTGNTFYGDYGGGPFFSTFNNYGTVRKDGSASSTTFDSATTFNNLGTVDSESGTLTLTTGNGTGVFNAASNAVVYLGNFDIFTLSGVSTFTGPGLVAGDLNGNNGVIHGALNFYFGTLQGTLTVASNAVANLVQANGQTQPISLNILTLTNCGTVVWSNLDLQCSSGAQVYNYGLWDALTGNTFYGDYGGGPFFSTFNNYGTVRKDGSTSSTTFDSATTFNNPGKIDVQNGVLSLQGFCLLNNGTLNLGISGPGQNGMINFANVVTLTGQLSANFENHYSPVVSNSFPVVEYNSETGAFTSLSLPPLSAGLVWRTNYTGTAFTLSIVPPPPPQLSAGLNVSGNSISLSWNGLSGQTYQVQCTTNLVPANWVNLGGSIPGTNGITITVSDTLTNSPQKFYRVELQ
jgi:hypothetical protein